MLVERSSSSIRLSACALSFALISPSLLPGETRPKIEKIADLPAYVYSVPAPVADLIRSPEKFEQFAKPVEADLLRLRSGYDIRNQTLQSRTLELLTKLDLMSGRYESGISLARQVRASQSKVALKLTAMLSEEAYMQSARSAKSTSGAPFVEGYRDNLERAVSALPYEQAWANLVAIRGFSERNSGPHLVTEMSQKFEAAREKTGTLGRDAAWEIADARCDFVLSEVGETTRSVIRKVEIAHGNRPAGIWPERSFILKPQLLYHPVTVAIWDSGIDPRLFPDRMWTDESGSSHGIAFTASGERTPELLRPLTAEEKQQSSTLSALVTGQLEIFANPEGPNAKRFRDAMKDTPPDQLGPLLEQIEDYRIASHGTMCAFSAAAGNPFIRLLSARTMGDQTNDTRLTHQPPSVTQSQVIAKSFSDLIIFLREHGVRVVNISWGIDPREFIAALERYGKEPDQGRREKQARAAFEVERNGLYSALASAPSILFVAASGNSDEDVAEAEIAPQSFHLSNLIKVGAVDPGGNAAGFTTFGSSVDVYAEGFQTAPLLGGQMSEFVGTSAAAPAIVNLAAKLLAVRPSLNPPEVIDLIKRGGSRNQEGLLVANPKNSMQILDKSGGVAPRN